MRIRGVELPNGTKLRMVDGSNVHEAVTQGDLIAAAGSTFENRSRAATACTGKSTLLARQAPGRERLDAFIVA